MVNRVVTARAPARIDLGGGWTDVPPYADREGGFVCNVAIARYSVARLTPRANGRSASGSNVDAPLVQATLKRTGVSDAQVTLSNDFPVGAGLGGSSAASAALLGALAQWRGAAWTSSEIAEEGRRIEVDELGVAGGRQDHYAATHGGALALTFGRQTDVRRLVLTAETRNAFVARSILLYTGESRISGDTITAVLGAYETGEPRVVEALDRMKALARAMARELERGDLDALGEMVREHWRHQRSLHPSIPTPRIDEIVARASHAGALGAKAMGASGGGCVWILGPLHAMDAIRRAVVTLGENLAFGLDETGLTVLPDES